MPMRMTDGDGDLLVIGGAEDKLGRRTVLKEFVQRAGGAEARIAVIPTASSLGPEIIEVYEALFTRLGAAEVYGVRPETRAQSADPALVHQLDHATGIFMTGGNQLKLSTVIAGTPFGQAILDARDRGVTVGGTSAGASIQSSHMVAFGPGGSTPKQRMTQVAAGLGLVQNCVIDQHFAQRHRYGRLLMIVAQSPQLLGMGVDEDTAAVITRTDDAELLRVVGRGSVTLMDGTRMVSNAHEAREHRPILASGVLLHVLPAGSEFDLTARALLPSSPRADAAESDELASANRDLRKMARDIAAGDIGPSVLRRRMARRSRGAVQ
jgi:cyanophycinase